MYLGNGDDLRIRKGTALLEPCVKQEFGYGNSEHINAHSDGTDVRSELEMAYRHDHGDAESANHSHKNTQCPASRKIAHRNGHKCAEKHDSLCTYVKDIRLLRDSRTQGCIDDGCRSSKGGIYKRCIKYL